MKALKWTLGGVAAVVLALLALPPLVPLEGYRANIARAASERLQEPVTLGKLSASLLPLPHLTASDVSVGERDVLKVGTVIVRPRFSSLFGEHKVLRVVELTDVAASQRALQRVAVLGARRNDERSGVQIEQIVLNNVLVKTPRRAIGPLNAEIALSEAGEPARATLRTADGKLRAELVPERDRYAIDVRAEDWTLPWGPALVFKALRMKGVATRGEAQFKDVAAEAYGGRARGRLELNWKDGVRVSGDLVLERMALAELLRAFSAKSRVTGHLHAKPVFKLRADGNGGLGSRLHLEGPFEVHDAVLRGVDLQAAASLLKPGERAGDTRFDELSGELLLDRGSYRFTRLKASSGALAARGELGLSPKKDLSGRVYAQLQAVGGVAEVPLIVSGTLDEPVVAPSGAAIAGAAVGTAVLGPVIGTTIGAKIGAATEKALGGKDPASD